MESKDRLYLQAWLEQRLSESADALAITLGVPTADVLAARPVIEVRGVRAHDAPMTAETLPCGHHIVLLVCSVESDYKFCELCETRDRLRDALTMERETLQERDRLRAELADVRREYNAALEVGLRDQRRADSAEVACDRLRAALEQGVCPRG